MFVPMAEGLMVDVTESDVVIDSLMEQLPGLFTETRETETILGPVIQVKPFFDKSKSASSFQKPNL